MNRFQVTVLATKGKSKIEYNSLKEASYAFKCSPNSIQFAAKNETKYQGWYFKIIRDNKAKCNTCGIELSDRRDDYCSKCYYEELTQKPFMESEKIGAQQTPTILYGAMPNE